MCPRTRGIICLPVQTVDVLTQYAPLLSKLGQRNAEPGGPDLDHFFVAHCLSCQAVRQKCKLKLTSCQHKNKLLRMDSEPHGIVERLLVALDLKTQSQLAATLAIRPQSIISAINRGEIPEAWLYRVAYLTGRNVEWLRTGKGPVWHGNVVAEGTAPSYVSARGQSAPLLRVLRAWGELDTEEQATVERCAEVLRIGDRDIREHLITQLKLIEETVQRRRAKRARRRRHSPS